MTAEHHARPLPPQACGPQRDAADCGPTADAPADGHASDRDAAPIPTVTADSAAASPTQESRKTAAEPPARPCPSLLGRGVLYALAIFFLGMGILGAFVPGLPTTVFILMAGWAAARSSPRLHAWLRNHRLFGSMLRNWEAGGFVHRKAKRTAVLVMSLSVLVMLAVGVPTWVLLLASGCMAGVAVWLWRRPEPPPDAD